MHIATAWQGWGKYALMLLQFYFFLDISQTDFEARKHAHKRRASKPSTALSLLEASVVEDMDETSTSSFVLLFASSLAFLLIHLSAI